MNKLKIAVLMGGTSSEHEISLKSSKFIYNTLDRSKYSVKTIPITRNGNWYIPENFENYLPSISTDFSNLSDLFFKEFFDKNEIKSSRGIGIQFLEGIDAVFIGLHGGQGENGTIQALLESFNIPYTGSGVLASALAMDKERANLLFDKIGLNVANYIAIKRNDYFENKNIFLEKFYLSFPVFGKPTLGGSSVGTAKLNSIDGLIQFLEKSFEKENNILFQEHIQGIEVSCGVLEKVVDKKIISTALPPTEIVPTNSFFDYEAKYITGKSTEITPARIENNIIKQVQDMSLLAHKMLGCKGYSRTDFIIQNSIPYILETNTLPGMTETSLIPQQARCIGLEMKNVFDNLIEIALNT